MLSGTTGMLALQSPEIQFRSGAGGERPRGEVLYSLLLLLPGDEEWFLRTRRRASEVWRLIFLMSRAWVLAEATVVRAVMYFWAIGKGVVAWVWWSCLVGELV